MQRINELITGISDGSRAAHAFIIEGRAGDTRRVFLDSLASGLLCTHPDQSARPCGICPACRQAAAGTNMDIVRMNKSVSSGKSGRETYKVDDASAFIERLSMGAYGRHLIGIVDDADILSETIQNKLLKTLEEPSPGTVILLVVSNRDNLLDTVRSRCAELRISDYREETDEGGEEPQGERTCEDLVRMILSTDTVFCEYRAAADKMLKTREDALSFLEILERSCREKMLSGGSRTPEEYACMIELINTARMDIRRDMNHTKAVKRLFLEMR